MKRVITCSSPINIAVIKYWGKRNAGLILPINSSLSCTISQDQLCTTTSIMLNTEFSEDILWLNDNKEDINKNKRIIRCLIELRRLRKEYEEINQNLERLSKIPIHIVTKNNFPTAAGLASSASGISCLVYSIYKLYELPMSIKELSKISRMGSGSACRSLYGGFVKWEKGELSDGSDSFAVQFKDELYWDDLQVLILVISSNKKSISSTSGMQTTVETSDLIKHRPIIGENRIKLMEKAIEEKNFQLFAEITMKDSNQFHALCLDTFPPIIYLNDVSKAVINLVTAFNDYKDSLKLAYTFDAGPNPVLFCLRSNLDEILYLINTKFPESTQNSIELQNDTFYQFNDKINEMPTYRKSLDRIIHSTIGSGPKVLLDSFSLINSQGFPKINC